MKFRKATAKYESWLSHYLTLLPADIKMKHEAMRVARFPFFRATYYRWAQVFPEVCKKLDSAVKVLGVGDLHVENFGTWRDVEGRLVWGINDFDETYPLPYTQDLVRLTASAILAMEENHLHIDPRQATQAILDGYADGLKTGGRPFVLAEGHPALREMAIHRLRDPEAFWQKLAKLPLLETGIRASAVRVIKEMFPEPELEYRLAHRVAGLGSLGRERFVAIAMYRGGHIAREAKALAPSAVMWAEGGRGTAKILYQRMLNRAVRCRDPFVALKGGWIVRRLAPDCSRIELASLPAQRDEIKLLRAMGFETANVHLGSVKAKAVLKDMKKRQGSWLHRAAHDMAAKVVEDWEEWRKAS
jgi:hypothetical protein